MIELNQERQSAQDEIADLRMQLENEKKKLPTVEIREKEIIKTEEKCINCSKAEYQIKLVALHGLTVGALIYSILITIINAVENNLLINDCKSFCLQVHGFVEYIIKSLNRGILEVSNELGNSSLYYALWVMTVGIIAYLVYRIILVLKNKSWTFWNTYAYSMLLIDLVLVVFRGEYIKGMLGVNLIWFAIGLYFIYIALRVVVYVIKNKHGKY